MAAYKKLISLADFPAALAKPRRIHDVQVDDLDAEVERRFQAALAYFQIEVTSSDPTRDLALELLNRIAPIFTVAVERRGAKPKRTALNRRQLLALAEKLGDKARSAPGRKRLKAKAAEFGLNVGDRALDNLVSRGRKDRDARKDRLLHRRQLRREATLRLYRLANPGMIGPSE